MTDVDTAGYEQRCLDSCDTPFPEFFYRIAPLARVVESLRAQVGFMPSPLLWDDPWEAVELRTELEFPLFVDERGVYSSGLRDEEPRRVGGTWKKTSGAGERVFCQCWSSVAENDTMWRAYSPDRQSVKLRVRGEALVGSLVSSADEGHVFFGKVKYFPQPEIEALLRNADANWRLQIRPMLFNPNPGEAWARTMLKKREQFRHEEEFRLILVPSENDLSVQASKLHQYPFDFNSVVLEIETDPRTTEHKAIEHQLRQAGYSGKVVPSPLYASPNLAVRTWWPENEGWTRRAESVLPANNKTTNEDGA